MIRFLRALAWLRWRILLNGMKSTRRDTMEQLSRVGAALAPLMLGALLFPSTLVLALAALWGGKIMGQDGESNVYVVNFARFLLAGVTLAVLMAPLVRSMQGLQVNLTRLMLLPIPRRTLHAAEVLAGLSDPWVAVTIPALVLLPLGLAIGGGWTVAGVALLGAAALLAVLSTLGAVLAFLVTLLFRERRRAELITLLLLLVLPLLGFLPGLIDQLEERPAVASGSGDVEPTAEQIDAAEREAARQRRARLNRVLLVAGVLPSELYGRAVRDAADGEGFPAALRLAALGAMAMILFGVSGAMHRRLLDDPAAGAARRDPSAARVRATRVPGLGPATSAVAVTQVRTVLRTVRGKAAVFIICGVLMLLYLLVADELLGAMPEWFAPGPWLLLVGGGLTWLSLSPALMNVFAVDGAGLTLEMLSPLSTREIVWGKLAGVGLLGLISIGLCLVASLLVASGGHPLYWLAVALGCLASYFVVAPVCALLSAIFPKPADLSRMGRAGNPHPLAGLFGTLVAALGVLPAMGVLATGMLVARNPWMTLLVMAGWTVVAAVLAVPFVALASAAVERRRENLLMVASGR